MNEPVNPKGMHDQCLLTCDCIASKGLSPACERCGFYKPEAERRKSIPLTLCEDGLCRKKV